MSIIINSEEYHSWHELGHATVCLHLGGDVEFIEFIDEAHQKGEARARCTTNPEIRKSVACGGFATEFHLLRTNCLEPVDEKKITQILFINATHDRDMYFNKANGDITTESEDREFMNHAVYQVRPIIEQRFYQMQEAVDELMRSRYLSGERVKQIMGFEVHSDIVFNNQNVEAQSDKQGKWWQFWLWFKT